MPVFSAANLIGGLVFGSIGFVAFIYGKRMHIWKPMFIGERHGNACDRRGRNGGAVFVPRVTALRSKSQIPIPKSQGSFQISILKEEFWDALVVWSLGFPWDLGFGICFAIREAALAC